MSNFILSNPSFATILPDGRVVIKESTDPLYLYGEGCDPNLLSFSLSGDLDRADLESLQYKKPKPLNPLEDFENRDARKLQVSLFDKLQFRAGIFASRFFRPQPSQSTKLVSRNKLIESLKSLVDERIGMKSKRKPSHIQSEMQQILAELNLNGEQYKYLDFSQKLTLLKAELLSDTKRFPDVLYVKILSHNLEIDEMLECQDEISHLVHVFLATGHLKKAVEFLEQIYTIFEEKTELIGLHDKENHFLATILGHICNSFSQRSGQLAQNSTLYNSLEDYQFCNLIQNLWKKMLASTDQQEEKTIKIVVTSLVGILEYFSDFAKAAGQDNPDMIWQIQFNLAFLLHKKKQSPRMNPQNTRQIHVYAMSPFDLNKIIENSCKILIEWYLGRKMFSHISLLLQDVAAHYISPSQGFKNFLIQTVDTNIEQLKNQFCREVDRFEINFRNKDDILRLIQKEKSIKDVLYHLTSRKIDLSAIEKPINERFEQLFYELIFSFTIVQDLPFHDEVFELYLKRFNPDDDDDFSIEGFFERIANKEKNHRRRSVQLSQKEGFMRHGIDPYASYTFGTTRTQKYEN